MIYVYVYPIEEYDRQIAVAELMRAHIEGDDVERYTLDEFMDAINDDVINTDTHWVKMMDNHENCYPISYLHIDDLKELKFDTGNVTKYDLLEIAERLDETYRELSYWICLKAIAEDLNIPKIKETKK